MPDLSAPAPSRNSALQQGKEIITAKVRQDNQVERARKEASRAGVLENLKNSPQGAKDPLRGQVVDFQA